MINYEVGNLIKINENWVQDIFDKYWDGVDILHVYQSSLNFFESTQVHGKRNHDFELASLSTFRERNTKGRRE